MSVVVLSSFHQDEVLASKSPRIMVNKGLVEEVFRISSKSWLEVHQSQIENFQTLYCLVLGTHRQHQYILYNFERRLHKQHIDLGLIISLHRHSETFYSRCKHLLILYYLDGLL